MEALLKVHSPDLTQDEVNRMQLEIAYRNAGQIKHAANVIGAVLLTYLASPVVCAVVYSWLNK